MTVRSLEAAMLRNARVKRQTEEHAIETGQGEDDQTAYPCINAADASSDVLNTYSGDFVHDLIVPSYDRYQAKEAVAKFG